MIDERAFEMFCDKANAYGPTRKTYLTIISGYEAARQSAEASEQAVDVTYAFQKWKEEIEKESGETLHEPFECASAFLAGWQSRSPKRKPTNPQPAEALSPEQAAHRTMQELHDAMEPREAPSLARAEISEERAVKVMAKAIAERLGMEWGPDCQKSWFTGKALSAFRALQSIATIAPKE